MYGWNGISGMKRSCCENATVRSLLAAQDSSGNIRHYIDPYSTI
jgi:hypothetical protein